MSTLNEKKIPSDKNYKKTGSVFKSNKKCRKEERFLKKGIHILNKDYQDTKDEEKFNFHIVERSNVSIFQYFYFS